MGIRLSEVDKFDLKDKLKELLQRLEVKEDKIIETIYTSIIGVLEADARWIQINQKDLEELSTRFDKRIPTGDFRINFGRILVRRLRGIIHREYYSEDTIVKGWHRQLLSDIRNIHRIKCDDTMSTQLFDLCQVYILKNKAA